MRSCRFCFNADGKDISPWLAPRAFIEICDVVLRLLQRASFIRYLTNQESSLWCIVNAPQLAHLAVPESEGFNIE
jgi:hypothetical protein